MKSAETANPYDATMAEGLPMQRMANRRFCHGKSARDNRSGRFLTMIEYKQVDRGHGFLCIDTWDPYAAALLVLRREAEDAAAGTAIPLSRMRCLD